MILNSENVKRLILYFMYDKDGVIDDYVPYMLRELKKNSTEILVVCNGKLTSEGRKKLEEVTPNVLVRENKGFDVWAYKTGLEHYGWDKIKSFDEVIMMNFTIMGPVYPLEEMFHAMDKRDLDFWGITKFHEFKDGDPFGTIPYGYIPAHIQSHFIAVRKPMLNSLEYQSYWDNMVMIHDYREAVGCHEAIFTKKFSDAGFKWDVYADLEEGYNNHPVLCATRRMIEEKRCPIFKRRSFMQNYDNILHDTAGENAIEAYEYIDRHTDYDVDMIWQNILRLENQADIKKNMQLNFVLPEDMSKPADDILKNRKVALVLHFYFEDLAEYCLHYVQSMPPEADIYVTTGSERKKELIEKTFSVLPNKVKVILIENRGRDVSALLVGTKDFIMDYDYVCFVHDKKVTQLKPDTVGASFSYKCFENLLTSRDFVNNVLHTFEANPRVGLLTPPPPNHGDYYITVGLEWGKNYKITKKLAEKLGITVPIAEEKEPIAPLGTMFWFRPKAMKLLFDQDWEYTDFPPEPNKTDGTLLHAMERIYSYVVQQEGYYPGWIFCEKGARIEVTNLHYMLRQLNKVVFYEGSGAGNGEDVIRKAKTAFEEWRYYSGLVGLSPEDTAVSAKLYLKEQNKDFVEEDTCMAESDIRTKAEFTYKDLEEFGQVKELRWDPGERSGIIVKDLTVTILTEDGKEIVKTAEQVESSAVVLDNELVFITLDPCVFITLDEPALLRSVVITANIVSRIPQDYVNRIREKFDVLRIKEDKLRTSETRLETAEVLLAHATRPMKQKIKDHLKRLVGIKN